MTTTNKNPRVSNNVDHNTSEVNKTLRSQRMNSNLLKSTITTACGESQTLNLCCLVPKLTKRNCFIVRVNPSVNTGRRRRRTTMVHANMVNKASDMHWVCNWKTHFSNGAIDEVMRIKMTMKMVKVTVNLLVLTTVKKKTN